MMLLSIDSETFYDISQEHQVWSLREKAPHPNLL
jgi:hypothetical protein